MPDLLESIRQFLNTLNTTLGQIRDALESALLAGQEAIAPYLVRLQAALLALVGGPINQIRGLQGERDWSLLAYSLPLLFLGAWFFLGFLKQRRLKTMVKELQSSQRYPHGSSHLGLPDSQLPAGVGRGFFEGLAGGWQDWYSGFTLNILAWLDEITENFPPLRDRTLWQRGIRRGLGVLDGLSEKIRHPWDSLDKALKGADAATSYEIWADGTKESNKDSAVLHKILHQEYYTRELWPQDFLAKLDELHAIWQKGTGSTGLLIGDHASGKSYCLQSLLVFWSLRHGAENYDMGESPAIQYVNLKRSQPAVLQNLVKVSGSANKPSIYLVDNLEALFVSEIGGMEVVENFLLHVERSKDRHLWIISTNADFYYYLTRYTQGLHSFERVLDFGEWKMEDILRYYERRFQQQGKRMRILPDARMNKTLAKRIRQKKLESQGVEALVRELYFQRLDDDGDLHLGYLDQMLENTYQRSLGNTLFFAMPENLDTGFLGAMEQSFLFVLKILLLHGPLSLEDLNRVLGGDLQGTDILLIKYHRLGLLKKEEGAYSIATKYLFAIKGLLRRKNLRLN
jgi:hypothetical protein